MAADAPITFEIESDAFKLVRTRAGVEFLVDGQSITKDLSSARVDKESRKIFFMGREAGKLEASQDIESIAESFESWFDSSTKVVHVDGAEDFDREKASGIAVGKFSATWCGPCKSVAPKIDRMSNQYPDVKFLHVDGDKCKDLMRREGATCYPTFFFYIDGVKQAMKIEGADATKVESTIKSLGAQKQEVEEEEYTGDGELNIVIERDTYILEKVDGAVSLTVNGTKIPAGRVPDVEVNTEERTVKFGRSGGVLYESEQYNVEEIMAQILTMFPTRVQHVHDTAEFDKIVKENAYVVAKYSADWCGPCHAIAPFFKELSNKHENVVFLHIDVDEVKALSSREGIQAMPTFDFWINGTKQTEKRIRGGNKAQLRNEVESFGN